MTAAPPFVDAGAIRAAVGFEDLIGPVSSALADFSRGLGESPVSVFAPAGPAGDVQVKSAWLPGYPIFVVKVATWFAERARRGGTAGAGMIAVFDAQTGDPRVVLCDEHHLSDIRTAAAGALAARLLARPDAGTVGVLGTGVQAYLQVLAAASERPIRAVRVWGRHPSRARRLAMALRSRRPDLDVTPVPTAQAACAGADLVITATASTRPLLEAGWLVPGMHVTAVGADDASKVELDPACVRRADRVVVDSRAVTASYGDLAQASQAGIQPRCRPAELGELLAGKNAGRIGHDEITVCKLVGLGVQDLAAADTALKLLAVGPTRQPASAEDLREGTE